jgi:DNA (cytosine-5)-methyltransferase 1
MRYGSVCSGIEAASVAWHPLGWEPQWFSEIEHFPSAVLKYRFPDVPNLGDMTQLNQNPVFNEQPIDLLVGGTPCQSFSVAGLRKGLADPRGNLMLTFLSIADKRRPKWIVWENVPGVLSSNGGRDFGTFLGALGELGYGFAYRVLDAQHFGVAQRRRRVFVVGHLGDWRPAAAVLFESESLQRNPKPSRAKREEAPTDAEGSVGEAGKSWWDGGQTAATLTKQNAGGNQRMPDKDNFGAVIEQVAQPIAVDTYNYTTNANVSQTLRSEKSDTEHIGAILHPIPVLAGEHPKKEVTIDVCPTLPAAMGMGGGHTPLVPHPIAVDAYNQTINEKTSQTIGSSASDVNHYGAVLEPKVFDWQSGGDARGLNLKDTAQLQRCQTPALLQTMAIRRLTPKECERLQGFPDDWTKIPYRNKPADQCPDGPRYKACGNSMAVPVMRWIGTRIQMIENYLNP